MQHAPRGMLHYAARAFRGKFSALTKGSSPVPATCQIPDIRQLYAKLGLPKHDGCFVEIGAFDGEQFSNTSFLADEGWRGLYVEPIPNFCRLVALRHILNKVSIERAAITDKVGYHSIHTMDALSTMNDGVFDVYKTTSWAKESAGIAKDLTIRTDTFHSVLSRHAIPEDFNLMVVDVEGGEEPIIYAMLASRWRPMTIIIELCDVHSSFDSYPTLQASHRNVRERLILSGYQQIYCDEINTIFAL